LSNTLTLLQKAVTDLLEKGEADVTLGELYRELGRKGFGGDVRWEILACKRKGKPSPVIMIPEGSAAEVEELREQLDFAATNPDHTLVTNFEVECVNVDQRGPDDPWEWELLPEGGKVDYEGPQDALADGWEPFEVEWNRGVVVAWLFRRCA
jgi:hypothetical protein